MSVDPQTLSIWLAGLVLVPFLAALFRSWSPDNPAFKPWVEFVAAFVLAAAVILWTGGLKALPWQDPVAFCYALAEVLSKIFALAVVVYQFLGEKLTLSLRTFAVRVYGARLWIWLFLILSGAGIALVGSALPAYADAPAPQPYVYALVKCSGLTVDQLVAAEQAFDTQYGYDHNLPSGDTPAGKAAWLGTYEARVNEFAALLGCNPPLNGGQLTFWYRIYVPTYRHYLGADKAEKLP